jgi:hypothetical protein
MAMKGISGSLALLSFASSMHRSLTVAIGLATALVFSLAAPAYATDPAAYKGLAWGTTAVVGANVVVGRTAVSQLGCRAEPGAHSDNTVATVDGGSVIATGAVNTSVDALVGPTATQSTAEVHGLSLLGGVITADLIKAVSTTSHDGSGFHFSGAGSSLANLKVAGIPILVVPAPNTRIDILGVGYVILNEQTTFVDEDSARLVVKMLHLVVTAGPFIDTSVVVGYAKSMLELRAGPLRGYAYATNVDLGDVVVSGPSALVTLPCPGTDGAVLTNSIDELSVPPVLSTGLAVTTAKGTVSPTLSTGKTTAAIFGINLVGGLITADVVKAVAIVKNNGTTVTVSDQGTKFVNLVVNGIPIVGEVAPNTVLDLPGVGTLWLRRTVEDADTIEVTMIQLTLLNGIDIKVGVANASAD